MPTETVATWVIIIGLGVMPVVVGILGHFLSTAVRRRTAFRKGERELLGSYSGYCGVEANFGCGHRQRIQLLDQGGCIVRNVLYSTALGRNCHVCWHRTGIDQRTLGA